MNHPFGQTFLTRWISKDALFTCVTFVTNNIWHTFLTFYASKSLFTSAHTIVFSTFQSSRTIRVTYTLWNKKYVSFSLKIRFVETYLDTMDNWNNWACIDYSCDQWYLLRIHYICCLWILLYTYHIYCHQIRVCKYNHHFHYSPKLNHQKYIHTLNRSMIISSNFTRFCGYLLMHSGKL